MTRIAWRALGVICLLAGASQSFAHHVWPVDNSREMTVRGTVTSYEWRDPHVMIGLDVAGTSSTVEKWNVGGPSLARMSGNGWTRDTLKVGDVITATGFRFADGQRVLRLEKVVMASGKEMFLYGRR